MSEIQWFDNSNDKPLVAEDLYELVRAVEAATPHPPYYLFAFNRTELKAALYWYGDCSDVYIIDSKNNMYHQRKKVGKFNGKFIGWEKAD